MKTLKPNKRELRGQITYFRTFLTLIILGLVVLNFIPVTHAQKVEAAIVNAVKSC